MEIEQVKETTRTSPKWRKRRLAFDESLPVRVREHVTCKKLEAGDFDCGLMQQRVKVVEEANPKDSDPCGGCREDRLFKKKYVRKRRVNNLESTSVGLVAGTSNVLHSLVNVDDAQRERWLYNNGETHSKSKQVEDNKTNREENQEITRNSKRTRYIQWRYSTIFLLAVEAITNQLALLDINME